MKKIAILINSPILGGAERSIIEQVSLINDKHECIYFIPIINNDKNKAKDLVRLLESKNAKFEFFDFPASIYQISRSSIGISLVKAVLGLIKLIFIYKSKQLASFDVIWANGNKVGLSSFIYCFFSRFEKKFVWHFRDFPTRSRGFNLIWKILTLKYKFIIKLIGNSLAVSEELKTITNNKVSVEAIYNPVANFKRVGNGREDISIIGFAGMFAPWKGIHELLVWSSLYEEELKALRIKKIKIYGDEIYLTNGNHTNYKQELEILSSKLPSNILEYAGIVSPCDIYNEIDVLIHASLDPEPFGRVITEAFSAGIPVISTSLGGAGELVKDNKTGLTHISNDYSGLYLSIKKIIEDKELRTRLITAGAEKKREVESSIMEKMNKAVN